MTGGRKRALIAWSSGKDSAYALHLAREAGALEIAGLLTTVTDVMGFLAFLGLATLILLR